ncbi:NTF2-like protein [Mycena kentingensis (nom. inval.)]|nr:NTF2-like protein [Mycena kentingensis (nom. inval.)]
MAPYTIADYLLDKSNIQDLVIRVGWCCDRGDWDGLTKLFADEVVVDYTEMMGGTPTHHTAAAQSQVWKDMLSGLDSTQHVFTGHLVDLPQPGNIEKPGEASGSCNFLITLRRAAAAAAGGPAVQSGGHYALKFVRTAVPGDTGNPWRLTHWKAYLSHMSGNPDVVKGEHTGVSWLDGVKFSKE